MGAIYPVLKADAVLQSLTTRTQSTIRPLANNHQSGSNNNTKLQRGFIDEQSETSTEFNTLCP